MLTSAEKIKEFAKKYINPLGSFVSYSLPNPSKYFNLNNIDDDGYFEQLKYIILDSGDLTRSYAPSGQGHTSIVHRIIAVHDFGDVKAGQLGGFVSHYDNMDPVLSPNNTCWIYKDGAVFDDAKICDCAKVMDKAWVYGKARVYDHATITDRAIIYDEAQIEGNACIHGNASVYNQAIVRDSAVVADSAIVCDRARINGNSVIYNWATIHEYAQICGSCDISGYAEVASNMVLKDRSISGKTKINTIWDFCDYNLSASSSHEENIKKSLEDEEIKRYNFNIDKMFTYLRAFCNGAGMKQSVVALNFARDKHEGQLRKDGAPYLAHPLSMACYAVSLGIRDDNIISTILLHDVAEDCGICIDDLPVSDNVKLGCKYMTVTKFDNDKSKIETKRRYFNELLECKEAIITKGFDRYNNLTDMPFAMNTDAVGKNCAETDVLLLPALKKAKEKWIDLSDIFFILRTNIRSINDIIKLYNKESYFKWKEIYENE